jgi:cell division protein FtsW (lipid II flippase)
VTDQIQGRLLKMAAAFLTLFAILLTLSPAGRERSWDVNYRLSHWLGVAVWAVAVYTLHHQTCRRLPERDPYLLPLAALLSGWGMLSVWRLTPGFGMRQTIWLGISAGVVILALRWPHVLTTLRRYKYVLLTSTLLLTALTLIFGANPAGTGPRLWLGCCGMYLQPSEPLKLLLIVYLAAYLADHLPERHQIFPLIFPTLFVTGLALLILVVQRDLGTASIFIMVYTCVLYVATGKKRVLLASAALLVTAGLLGTLVVDVVRIRMETWLNPWLDPSGRAFQIVQSLLAVANGGLLGRGPGMGSPGLVPVAHSDFIFSSIAEETGLFGTVAMLALYAILIQRGVRAALQATNRFRRLLAIGLTAYLGIQTILIVGGNLRMLPLTGVTLPFVSYGGSSLLTSFLAIFFLLSISNSGDDEPAHLATPIPYLTFGGLLLVGLAAAALTNGYWSLVQGPDMLTRTDNARRSIADIYVKRGSLLDRNNTPITVTQGESGDYRRVYLYPELGPVIGYTHPVYGQAGLEASLDPTLRGLQGNPAPLIWWDHLLYGTPPPGLDVRLSIDLDLQRRADELLGQRSGAVLLLNAQSGEILAMASHPTYDPNTLDTTGPALSRDERAPLINRASQGRYPIGKLTTLFLRPLPGVVAPRTPDAEALFAKLGFYSIPQANLPTAEASHPGEDLALSPLQVAIGSAALSNQGLRPTARIALAVDTSSEGWVILSPAGQPVQAYPAGDVEDAMQAWNTPGEPYWQFVALGGTGKNRVAWYVAGSMPGWNGTPLTVVVLLEGQPPSSAQVIGRSLLESALAP